MVNSAKSVASKHVHHPTYKFNLELVLLQWICVRREGERERFKNGSLEGKKKAVKGADPSTQGRGYHGNGRLYV